MRRIRDAVCLLVALGSVALAAMQPAVGTDAAGATPEAAAPRPVDQRLPQTIDRAIASAPLLKA